MATKTKKIDSKSTTEQIQKQSRRINIIEEDTQKLFSGLSQVRGQSDLVLKINNQTSRLQDQINKITESQKASPETKNILQKQKLLPLLVQILEKLEKKLNQFQEKPKKLNRWEELSTI